MALDIEERRALVTALRRGDTSDGVVFPVIEVLRRSWPDGLAAMAADELLIESLRSFPVCPKWFERRMTTVRRDLLFTPPGAEAATLLGALAIQCQLNEYAWVEDPEETARVETLLAAGADLTAEEVMALGCYRPLSDLEAADALLAKAWSGPVARVLGEQIVAVREERAIAAGLPAVTPIRQGVSADVQAQYEEHPYPRWRRVFQPPAIRNIAGRPAPVRPLLLVAGCGTGRHAIQAHTMFDAERTVAVDLSRRSLAYAALKTKEQGLQGIEYVHGDILELPDRYPETFDIVASVGVLHHMADPFEGVRAVCRTLKPGGLLNLGLYSSTARADLEPARKLARDYTPDTVRELRQAILDRPLGDPVRRPAGSRDFYASSGCRDLLMHVQEHQMTFADLRRILEENGLRFLGMIPPDAAIAASYRAAFPHDPLGLDLNAWEQFESAHPKTFARMYTFWAEKPDGVLPKPEIGLAGDAALSHLQANWPHVDAALVADEVLAKVLRNTAALPQWLEGRLTTLRRRLLIGSAVEALSGILPALASRCLMDGYAWREDNIERQLVERLARRIGKLTPDEAMTLACYRPLRDVPGAETLADRDWSGAVAQVLAEQFASRPGPA